MNDITVRQDIQDMHDRTWKRMAEAATWFEGATRVAIAAETRTAKDCELCQQRNNALSPQAVSGKHDTHTDLPENIAEVVHRISTDPGRLSKLWYNQVLESGVSDSEYIETLALVCSVVSIDTFYKGIGSPLRPLPEPVAGEPLRERPANAKIQLAWMATVEPEDILDNEFNPYREDNRFNVQKALSLVPRSLVEFYDVDETYYLPQKDIRNYDSNYRALSHSQMELIGSRGAQINQCHYCSLSHTGVLVDSAEHEGKKVNLNTITGNAFHDSGIDHGETLLRFTDALLTDDQAELESTRLTLFKELGNDGLVDAAATAASFNSIPRIPNATGIPLEDWKHEKLFPIMNEYGIGNALSSTEAEYKDK